MYGGISEMSLVLTMWLQGLGDGFISVMAIITEFGGQEFYMLLMATFIWLVDYAFGVRLAVIVLSSAAINFVAKLFIHAPRPYWIDPTINASAWENLFGAPSGHAQTPVVAYGLIAHHFKKRWFSIALWIFIFLIGISRIVLGTHFIEDTISGFLLGGILLWLFIKYEKPITAWASAKSVAGQYGLALVFSFGFILLGWVAMTLTAQWEMPQTWITNASNSPHAEGVFNPNNLESILTPAGALFGGLAGLIWLSTQLKYNTKGKGWQYAVRFVVGLIGMLGLWMGLDMIFPDNGDLISYALRFVRYMAVAFWVTGFAPWLFTKLNLTADSN